MYILMFIILFLYSLIQLFLIYRYNKNIHLYQKTKYILKTNIIFNFILVVLYLMNLNFFLDVKYSLILFFLFLLTINIFFYYLIELNYLFYVNKFLLYNKSQKKIKNKKLMFIYFGIKLLLISEIYSIPLFYYRIIDNYIKLKQKLKLYKLPYQQNEYFIEYTFYKLCDKILNSIHFLFYVIFIILFISFVIYNFYNFYKKNFDTKIQISKYKINNKKILLLTGCIIILLIFTLIIFINNMNPNFYKKNIENLFFDKNNLLLSILHFILTYVILYFIIAFFEELFFRFILFEYIIDFYNKKIFLIIILISIIFAVTHLNFNIYSLSLRFLLSMLLFLFRIKYNKLILNSIIHWVYNFTIFLLLTQ